MDDLLGVVLFLVAGIIGSWVLWKWFNKKKFRALEEKKWLKILLTIVLGFILGLVICVIGAIALGIRIACKSQN